MKYYEKMLDMGCFTKDDVVKLAGSEGAAHSLLYDYTRNRLIERVRRNLYAAVSLETKQPVANRYVIASHLAPDACVSHHSAFEVYGYANQVYYEVYVQTELRFTDFEYNGATYRRVSPRISDGVTKWNGNVRVTTPERTVIDSINDFEKIGGLEELLRCIELIPSLDPMMLLKYLDAYGNGFLYQKVGYILEQFQDTTGLPQDFFAECRSKCSQSKRYLYSGVQSDGAVYHEKWRLFAPPDLHTITNKGVNGYDEI